MPDEVKPAPAPQPAPAPEGDKGTPAPADKAAASIPEKFKGKSLEDIAKAYTELESTHGEYASIGKSSDIKEALDWARNMKAALDRGLLVPAGTKPKETPAAPAEPAEPWSADDWAYKSPAEQAKAMSDFTQKQIKSYVDGLAAQYGEQIKGLAGRDGREKSILMKVIKTAIKNPNVDPEDLLTQAAELGSKSPEELVDLVMEARSHSPESQKAEIDRAVEARLAEEKQKWEGSLMSDLVTSARPKPRLSAATPANRQAEDKSIIDGLAKQGIRLI